MMSGAPPGGKADDDALAATDRLVPSRSARRPGARQHPLPDAEICCGEVSFDHLVGARCQLRPLAGREHGQTMPLTNAALSAAAGARAANMPHPSANKRGF